jgi:hypothetical protein
MQFVPLTPVCPFGQEINSGGIMKGLIFRLGVRIKDFGERLACVPVLRVFCTPVISLGLAVRGFALNMNSKGM